MFRLSDEFIERYRHVEPPFGPLGLITYARTYSRIKDDGEQEEFWETCRRVVEGVYQIQEKHCKQLSLPWRSTKAQRSAQEMYDRMFNMKWLPPGRGLWAMGTGIVDKVGAAALMNCGFASTKDLKTDFGGPFAFLMDMLMLGVGIGFDTLGAGTVTIRAPKQNEEIYVVEDTREGWVALTRKYINAYAGQDVLPMMVDYSKVRPAGAPLKTFGGVASGPGPLMDLVDDVEEILHPLVGQKITSAAIVDLGNVIGKCVVAGNVRRSAELVLGSPDDEDFVQLKDKDLHSKELMSHRWASNNSVSARIGMNYEKLGARTATNGEPGFIWLENARQFGRMKDGDRYPDMDVMGFNPCVEQPLEDRELCCLVETFPSRHENLDDYKRTLKFAYLYGKTVTLIPTHDERSNAVILRNRRVGTSQSGIVQAMAKFGRRKFFEMCDEGYSYLRSLDKIYSRWLCIPTSIKITTVKPSGTVSLLPGVTPGIHYPHSEFYMRTIRFQADSPLVETLTRANYRIEVDAYSPNTVVAYFPIHEPYFERSKTQVTMWEQLENAAAMQHYWSDNGVSATVTFSQEEAKDIPKALELYEGRLKAISFLPLEDHGYVQAPYQECSRGEYETYAATLKPLAGTIEKDSIDAYCDGVACQIPVLALA